jgi:hypothetical protein
VAKHIFLSLVMVVVLSAYCHSKPGGIHNNTNPVWTGPHKLLRSGQYGKLYEIGTGDSTMKLLHVYGNMYQMGYAQGELLKN